MTLRRREWFVLKRRQWLYLLICLSVLLQGCGNSPQPNGHKVIVAAASDLKFALDEAIHQFRTQNPSIDVQPVYGSSGNFYAQVANNAPFDMFMSADMEYPRNLQRDGLVIDGSEFRYAVGRIVVWSRNDSPLNVQGSGMQVLLNPSIQKVSIANPQHAPYGKAAVSAMQNFGVYDKVKDKLVIAENVSQALQFIESGTADVGIVAMSLATAPNVRSRGQYFEVPLDAYPRMDQGGVILKTVRDRDAAEQFRTFVLSAPGQTIFRQFGFSLPDESQ
jgi:molybdate transport system substrate-binding protein